MIIINILILVKILLKYYFFVQNKKIKQKQKQYAFFQIIKNKIKPIIFGDDDCMPVLSQVNSNSFNNKFIIIMKLLKIEYYLLK
jgi:hypothetical protein